MIKLYLIGGLIVAIFIFATVIYYKIRAGGRKAENYERLVDGVKSEQETTKRDIKRRNSGAAARDKRMRKYQID